jgi:hypothetical protein
MRSIALIDDDPAAPPVNAPPGTGLRAPGIGGPISFTTRIVVVHGAALALVVGVDGPAPWPAVRALVFGGMAAATAQAWHRSDSRAARWAVLVVGLVGVVLGVGIGVPQNVRAGKYVEAAYGVHAH